MKTLESIDSKKFKVVSDQEMSNVNGGVGYTIAPVTVTPNGSMMDKFKSDIDRDEADNL